MWLTLAVITILHLPTVDHSCHLQNSDWWSESLTTEYVRTDSKGSAMVLTTTSDGCLCLVRIPASVHRDMVESMLSGRAVIAAGWQEDGWLVLERVCESFEGCVASRNQEQ